MAVSANRKLEKTTSLLREAIPRMSKLQIPLTPENYHTWYEYTMGGIGELNLAIDTLIENKTRFTSKVNHDLYQAHIKIPSPEAVLKSYQEDMQALVSKLLDKISGMTEKTKSFSGTLEKYNTVLKNSPDIDTISGLISNLLDETESVMDSNQSMEGMLESMNSEVDSLRGNLDSLSTKAFTDQLTAVPNRRAFDQKIDELFDKLYEENEIFCLLLIDIDHFKLFNDTHGHAVGDKVLKYVASIMNGGVKGNDLLARYGGEEFGVLLPLTDLADAISVANNIREKIASNKLVDNKSETELGNINVSIGVAISAKNDDAESIIVRADKALYLAKESGRNCVKAETDLAQPKSNIAI